MDIETQDCPEISNPSQPTIIGNIRIEDDQGTVSGASQLMQGSILAGPSRFFVAMDIAA
jgi:hypothetical protein